MSKVLFVIAGTIFCMLGLLHAIFTAGDLRRPRRLAPEDPNVVAQMAASGLRLSRGRTNMWSAWIGFNFSHSLGLIIFGLLCIAAGVVAAVPKAAPPLLAFTAALYFVLAIRFWFRVPAIAMGIATGCLLAGWLLD